MTLMDHTNILSLDEPIDKDQLLYTIITKGKRRFHVYGKVLRKSILLDTLITETDELEFELNEIDGDIMCYILCYMEYISHYQDIPIPIHPGLYRKTDSTNWFYNFIETFDKITIKKIIHFANYLHIESLIHLGCFHIANRYNTKQINHNVSPESSV